ncbi:MULTISPECIES: ferritin-like domain-containing protein [unclassified Sphingomonas]|uniref:ferritin-like domain-containing protein n=1 Tax=unclassified Sphingomonas TaxID=196159 RepID=UPI000831306D|nr:MULTISPECIES: ferritin-like domain-containing protein [unclassified Sphingomonas]
MTTSIAAAAHGVLTTAGPTAKVMAARTAARAWRRGVLAHRFDVPMPRVPARPAHPELLPAAEMPRRGRGGSARGRIALLHALAHIEFVAIDLAFDLIGRFGASFPRGFVDDWIAVAADEAMHFALLHRRLVSLGSGYGALPAHDGLWDAAMATAHDPLARLAVVPMVLEARGLDVTPVTIERLQAAGDGTSARILTRIFNDEIRHVSAGTRWFESVCREAGHDAPRHWQMLVTQHFRGAIKPPFNDSARTTAGLTRDYYAELAPV